MEVEIALFDGFDELDAIGPYEVLMHGADAGADISASLATMDGQERVTASHGAQIGADRTLGATGPDLVVVPGGGWGDRAEAGAWAEAERGGLPRQLAAMHEDGATTASVCTGAMLLARAGLLDGRPAVTHHVATEDLRETDARLVDARVVDDGDVLSAGGITSGIDLALHLLEREFGPDLAETVADWMEYARRGTVHRA
jgi:transcriptional regulator GlxA family with amidase domain